VVIENSRQYRRMHERDRLAALGQMAAGLAHEVKNPLGAIKGAAQLLNEPGHGKQPSAQEREFLTIILEEVERLDRVVGDVLDYARPSRGNIGALDLNSVVSRTLKVLSSNREDECRVQTKLADDLPEVRADAELLRQVLINLVKNAMEAMEGRGQVTVTTRLRSPRHLDASGGEQARGWAEIAVRDEGTGISDSVLQSLFVPFFTTKAKGTGLGLAISQRMVEEMGGRIEVVSQQGAGATFTLVLPLAPEGASSLTSGSSEALEHAESDDALAPPVRAE
jgi:two-component system sensor histidine kinase HydH